MVYPHIAKVAEAYTAIEDKRVQIFESSAIVRSSNGEKEYLIKWKDNVFYSNDNSTYWQNTIGYPIIAVLMMQNRLSFNKEVSKYFRNINWNKINKGTKRNYEDSLNIILKNFNNEVNESIIKEINKVFEEIKTLDIVLSRKKNL